MSVSVYNLGQKNLLSEWTTAHFGPKGVSALYEPRTIGTVDPGVFAHKG